MQQAPQQPLPGHPPLHGPCIRPARPSSTRAASPLQLLNTGDEDIDENEFKQSLRMRASVDYIHPSVMGMLPGGSGSPQRAAARALGPNQGVEEEAASAAAEASATLNAPVSGVSLGLLHGAARARAEAANVGPGYNMDAVSKAEEDSTAAAPPTHLPMSGTILSRTMRRPAPKP